MNIEDFDDLLRAARAQAVPQRLMLVFMAAELPDDCTDEQRRAYQRGEGGTLAPVMCVDKRPEDLASFAALVAEANAMGMHWTLLFAGALGQVGAHALQDSEVQAAMQKLVARLQAGQLGEVIPFNRQGEAVALG